MINNKPEVRFSGFNEEWGSLLFSEIVNRITMQSNDASLPKVEFEDIISGEGKLNKDVSQKFDGRKGIIFEPNFILYGKLRPYLKNWLFPDFKGIALGDFWVFEAKNTAPSFIYYLIQGSSYQAVANLSAGSKMPRSDWKTVSKTEFRVPLVEEQTQIGNFFKELDQAIDLHQQEITTLKQTKQGFLQKMFPLEGESVPEVRFPGFIGNWEQRTLESIFGKIRNAFVGTATPYYVEKGHFYLESNNVKDGKINRISEVFINNEFYEKQRDNWLHTGDLVMVQSGHVGHTAVIPEELNNTAAHALIMFSDYLEQTDPYFLNYQLQSQASLNKLGKITTGNTIKHILASEMKKFLVDLPSYREQLAIGNFFKQLDDLITCNERELDTLKITKKAFLQKMFV